MMKQTLKTQLAIDLSSFGEFSEICCGGCLVRRTSVANVSGFPEAQTPLQRSR
jgi:hypothetical protein